MKYAAEYTQMFESSKSVEQRFPDRQFLRMLEKDARDLLKIYSALLAGENSAALRTWRSLDTAARDEVPAPIWNFMESLAES
jgi:hypothetical protein